MGKLPEPLINYFSRFFPPVYISHIVGIQSIVTQREVEGWFVACPLTPQRMLTLPPNVVYEKIIQTGRLAQSKGAKLLGLGAFTSVVGDGGITIAKSLDIPVTTGDSYTVAIAVEATIKAAQAMEIDLNRATAAVVGASGAIGRVCARLLSNYVPDLLLIGRSKKRLNEVKYVVDQARSASTAVSTTMDDLSRADVIITVSSAVESIIEPQHLKSGAVVCDVARPRDVSRKVVETRNDVLVIEGGMVEVPGVVDFNFDFGFPPGMAYACMAETMALAMAQRYESFSLGKEISLENVQKIDQIASCHGFKLGGFRSFEKPVTQSDIEIVKSNVTQPTLAKYC